DMTQSILLVRASHLASSPANVRKHSDPAADAQLEASIVAHGVLQNLIGLPVARKKGHYRITAGNRRLSAVHRAIEKGDLPQDFEIPIMVVAGAGNAIEISMSENFFNLAMNPADACRAFQDIIEIEKKSPADVAKRFGLTERFVLGRLRLAALAEPIFDALGNNEITLDVAIAYASTSDTARQLAVFEQMAGYHRPGPDQVRRQIATYAYRASDPRAILAGREAYLAAGGRIDRDLFSDSDSESWLDTHIVDRLAEEALTAAAERVRGREGYAEVRLVAATHVPYADTYGLQPLIGEPVPLTAEEEARQAEIETELALLEAQTDPDSGAHSDADATRIDELEDELATLVERVPVLDEEMKKGALAYLVIGPDGQPRVHEQLYAATAADHADDADELSADGGDESEDLEREGAPARSPISQRLTDELAMMKAELVRLHVASDPAFALDLGVFLMIEMATGKSHGFEMPSELRADAPSARAHGFVSTTPAAIRWTELAEGLDMSWADAPTITERYDAFCALGDDARASWLGWAIARTLRAIPAGQRGSAFLDHIGRKLDIDVAAWWRPSAANYFDRISKPSILGLLEDVGGAELRHRYAASKKHDLALSAERLFAGQTIVEADIKDRLLTWLPDAMLLAPGSTIAVVDRDVDHPADGVAPTEGIPVAPVDGAIAAAA
ncbi:MAG: chromosome partitioning protein ParB family, partial [Rhizorhabdus sp.]|nr:chromosome partitioning protein ParB family [Rhizorhabdus sp.]